MPVNKTALVVTGVISVATLLLKKRRRAMSSSSSSSSSSAATKQPQQSLASAPSDSISLQSQLQLRLPIIVRPDLLPAHVGGWAVGEAAWLYDRCAVIPLLVPRSALSEHRSSKQPSLENAMIRVKVLRSDDTVAHYCHKRNLSCIPLDDNKDGDIFVYQVLENRSGEAEEEGFTVTVGCNIVVNSTSSLSRGNGEKSGGSTTTMCTLSLFGKHLGNWASLCDDAALQIPQLLQAVQRLEMPDEATTTSSLPLGVLQLLVRKDAQSSAYAFPIVNSRASVEVHPERADELHICRDDHTIVVPLQQSPAEWSIQALFPAVMLSVEDVLSSSSILLWKRVAPNAEVALRYLRDGFGLSFAVPLNVLCTDAYFSLHPMVLLQFDHDAIVASVTQVSELPSGWEVPPAGASSSLVAELFEQNVLRCLVRAVDPLSKDVRSPIEPWTVSGTRALTFVETDSQRQLPLMARTIVIPQSSSLATDHQPLWPRFWIVRWQAPVATWAEHLPLLHSFLSTITVLPSDHSTE